MFIMFCRQSSGGKVDRMNSQLLEMSGFFFLLPQLHLQACCTSASLTCPTTASITSRMGCWRTSTSCGGCRWRATHGSVTTTSTTWSTGSSTTQPSCTVAWSAPNQRSSGAGASKTTSRPTTGNVQRINKLEGWTRSREGKTEQTMRPRRCWGRQVWAMGRVCLSLWGRSPTSLRSSGWARMETHRWTGTL